MLLRICRCCNSVERLARVTTARAATSQQAAPASLFCSLRAGVRSRRPLTSCRCCGRTLCAGATYQRRPRVRRMNRVAEARMRLAGTSIVNVFVAVIAGRWLHATSSTIKSCKRTTRALVVLSDAYVAPRPRFTASSNQQSPLRSCLTRATFGAARAPRRRSARTVA